MIGKTSWKTVVTAISFAVGLLGINAYSASTANILVDVTIPDSKVFEGPVRLTVRELILKPGEELPLHYHPGNVFIAVKSGTLTVEDGCGEEKKLTPGQGLEKLVGRVHRGKNVEATDVVVYDIFFTTPGQPTTVTIPENEHRCGPPKDTDECANNGWRTFNHPRNFKNQGECEQFVRDMPRKVFQVPSTQHDEQ
jgi:quercetin dioxygenase-like cupin family protein